MVSIFGKLAKEVIGADIAITLDEGSVKVKDR